VLFGFLLTLFSYRLLMGTSMLMALVATYLLSRAGIHSSQGYMICLMVLLGLLGIGPMMSLAQNAIAANVAVKYIGISSSLVGFCRSIGGVLGASITATLVNNNLKQRLIDGAAVHQIPLDKIDQLANPQLLVKASSQVPVQLEDFLRESLGSAINHGYLLSIIAASIGLGAALLIGPGRFQKKSAAAEVSSNVAQA
ncbi:MAG: putative multidrug resistance protein, partial [Bacilli bacterium]|nr:putative multidrug resistance protein [Bacilli bacterium]